MKVGVYIDNKLPEIGGAYSFQREIISSLLKLAPESNHIFALIGWGRKPPAGISLNTSLEFISLYRTIGERLYSKVSGRGAALGKKLMHPRIKFEVEGWYEKHVLNSLQKYGIDIIWSPNPSRLTMNIPYITTVWDLQHRLQPYFPEVSFQEQWENREKHNATILRRATFIIVGTKEGKREIEDFYQVPSERIKVLPFPTPQFALNANKSKQEEVLKKYGIQKEYILYPAQFWPHKNHINLLLAVKWLHEKHNLDFSIVFAGSDKGNESFVRRRAEELGLSKRVHFLGFVPLNELISLYCNAFALSFVTFFGPDNLPPLEAMGLRCPVITSNVPGAKEQLGDAALFVNPKDPEEIGSAIKSLSDDTNLRQKLVERGFARASMWTGRDYVRSVFSVLDDFEAIRRCWSNT